jgi:hypothetical protein
VSLMQHGILIRDFDIKVANPTAVVKKKRTSFQKFGSPFARE